jgi:hypothetical protein
MYMTAQGKRLKQDYHLEARSQWGRRAPLAGNVELSVTLYFRRKETRHRGGPGFSVVRAQSLL